MTTIRYLHQAMEDVLRGQGFMSLDQVAQQIALRGLWRRPSDGAYPDAAQIRRRAVQSNGRHLERFEVTGNQIRLR
jgi:hypothetical protein